MTDVLMLFPIVYAYYKSGERIRIRHTINYLKRCSSPFLDVGCGSKRISKKVAAVTVEVCERRRHDVATSKDACA